jgi:hypothetical protein
MNSGLVLLLVSVLEYSHFAFSWSRHAILPYRRQTRSNSVPSGLPVTREV